MANYDGIRGRIQITDFESYIYGDPAKHDYILADDRVCWGKPSDVRRKLLQRIGDSVEPYIQSVENPIVIEFGCGEGGNLLYLKRRFPRARFLGLELSPVSVALAKDAANKFGLQVDFFQANVTEQLPSLPDDVTVVYSVHALEQMPKIYRSALSSMLALARQAVLFFEPIGELYPLTFRGYVSRLRLIRMDYLRGLRRELKNRKVRIIKAERLGFAPNPLNETVEIHALIGDSYQSCATVKYH